MARSRSQSKNLLSASLLIRLLFVGLVGAFCIAAGKYLVDNPINLSNYAAKPINPGVIGNIFEQNITSDTARKSMQDDQTVKRQYRFAFKAKCLNGQELIDGSYFFPYFTLRGSGKNVNAPRFLEKEGLWTLNINSERDFAGIPWKDLDTFYVGIHTDPLTYGLGINVARDQDRMFAYLGPSGYVGKVVEIPSGSYTFNYLIQDSDKRYGWLCDWREKKYEVQPKLICPVGKTLNSLAQANKLKLWGAVWPPNPLKITTSNAESINSPALALVLTTRSWASYAYAGLQLPSGEYLIPQGFSDYKSGLKLGGDFYETYQNIVGTGRYFTSSIPLFKWNTSMLPAGSLQLEFMAPHTWCQ